MIQLPNKQLERELDALEKAVTDPFFPNEAEILLRSQFEDTFAFQLTRAWDEISKLTIKNYYTKPSIDEVDEIMEILGRHLSGTAITSRLRPLGLIQEAFDAGRRHVQHQYQQQTGRTPQKKADVVGLFFGKTDSHAVKAIENQTILSAGGYWDTAISDQIRKELLGWFNGEETTNSFGTTGPMTRAQFAGRLKDLINPARAKDGKTNKAGISEMSDHYFRGLAENLIVRARNIGSFYQADELGATSYVIKNPDDQRTSGICRELINSSWKFAMADARNTVDAIIGATSLEQLKSRVPFLTTAADAVGPVPPLHWMCRSWMEFIFA